MDIKKAFDIQYKDEFNIPGKKVIGHYTFTMSKIEYRIRLSKGKGIFKTELFIVEVLRKEKGEYIKWNRFNRQYNNELRATKHIEKLMKGGDDAK